MLPASLRSELVSDPHGLDGLIRCLVRAVGKEVRHTSGGGAVLALVATIAAVVCVMAWLEGSQMPPVPSLDASWLPMRLGGWGTIL